MYIKNINIKSYGPIEYLNCTPTFDNIDGTPNPIVLVGQNGVGKTLVLSNILQAIIEIKRREYRQIKEVSGNNFYRVGSIDYIKTDAATAYNRILFDCDASFTEIMTRNYDNLKQSFSDELYPGIDINNEELKQTGFFNTVSLPMDNVFENSIYLFFPVERYYIPTWENKSNEGLKYITQEQNFVGISSSNMVKYNVLKNIEEWLLDVIIDKELYDTKSFKRNEDGTYSIAYNGRNTNIQGIINELISILYEYKGYDSARIGITARTRLYRQIKIIGSREGKEVEIMPSISNLSSGEAMILGIMASILREADRISGEKEIKADEIKGIVLIDEIDAHLHSDLLQDVLPKIIATFKEIQFIVTSHSPFFLIGMHNQFEQNCQFINLPDGMNMEHILDFYEIQKCFDLVDINYNNVINQYNEILNKSKQEEKPLIITEGKTDWKHLKHALKVFQKQGKFMQLNVTFHEYEEEMGASKLENLLKYLAMIDHSAPIIGIFDDDSAEGKRHLEIREYGRNVYGCCISDTQGYGCEISIELLYDKNDLTRVCSDKKRLYLSDEFMEKSHQLKNDITVVSQNRTINDAYKRKIIKVVDSEVYNNKQENIAISKDEFAKRVFSEVYPYEGMDVSGFNDIFIKIEKILKNEIHS